MPPTIVPPRPQPPAAPGPAPHAAFAPAPRPARLGYAVAVPGGVHPRPSARRAVASLPATGDR